MAAKRSLVYVTLCRISTFSRWLRVLCIDLKMEVEGLLNGGIGWHMYRTWCMVGFYCWGCLLTGSVGVHFPLLSPWEMAPQGCNCLVMPNPLSAFTQVPLQWCLNCTLPSVAASWYHYAPSFLWWHIDMCSSFYGGTLIYHGSTSSLCQSIALTVAHQALHFLSCFTVHPGL
jgi:hypothetical protein